MTRVISSFGGTTAIVPVWLTRALSSLRACEPVAPAASVVLFAVNAEHPLAGSTKSDSSRSSLPLAIAVAPVSEFALAGVSCAVWPFPLIRYVETTLSLWSWSTRAKLRTVSHAWPSVAVPIAGTFSAPDAIAALAAR